MVTKMSQMKDRLDEILLCNVGGKPPSTSLRAAAVVVVKDGKYNREPAKCIEDGRAGALDMTD